MERKQSQSADTSASNKAATTQDYQSVSAAVPKKIGRFEVLDVLGQGAFGKVYKARDPQLDREVAIKVPLQVALGQPEEVDRFLREARAVAALRHPNLCAIHEVGPPEEGSYIVMAYVPGKSLAEFLRQRKEPIDGKQAALILRKLALGLNAAHTKGIIHRDLKPANIMIDRDRKDVVIMDFGLARYRKQGDAQRTREGMMVGTPAYMSPEQARGDNIAIGPASDIYSLGAILYEMLAGRPPFTGSLTEIVGKVLHVEPEPPSQVRPGADSRLEAICLKALAKDPADRYASMRDLANTLDGYLKGVQADAPKAAAAKAEEPKETGQLSQVMRALASEYRQQTRAAVDEAVRRVRFPLWKLLAGAGVLAALLVTAVILFAPTPAGNQPTKTVLLNIDVNFNDVTLVFMLDGREVTGRELQAPMDLPFGNHELVVLRDSEPIQVHQFEVTDQTEQEIPLRQRDPPPAEDEEIQPGLPADTVPSDPLPPPGASRQEQRRKSEWVQLFNGKDLTGWRMLPNTHGIWRVDNGILSWERGGGYSHLFTEENDWTDVHVRIVAKFSTANTWVCIRSPFVHTPQMVSYQVIIGATKKRLAGSLTIGGRVAGGTLSNQKLVAPDSWFTTDVIVRGNRIVTKVNDKVVVDYEDGNKTYAKGHIVLRPPAAKSAVQFKSIEVRDLAPEKVPVPSAGDGTYTIHTIPLSEPVGKPNPPFLMMHRVPGGGFKLGWNDTKGSAHITSLGEDLKPISSDIVLPNTQLRGLAVNQDQTTLALVFEAPHQIQARGLDKSGREIFRTVLSGESGNGPGTKFGQPWLLAKGKIVTSGQDFAVHFGHFSHTMKHGTHQGGCYAQLDRQGNILKKNAWTVSHSIDQALLYHTGEYLTVSVGDAFPKGLPFINRTRKGNRLIYPPADQQSTYQPKWTHLGSMVAVGEDVGLAFGTNVSDAWKYFYVLMDKSGEVKQLVTMREGMKVKHSGVNLAPFGSNLLLIWKETDTRTGFAPIDGTGRFLRQPSFVDEVFQRRNDLPVFANGDVGWLTASPSATEVKLVRVKR